MKKAVLGLCLTLFASNMFAGKLPSHDNLVRDKITKIEYFENGVTIVYGCSVYIAWHDTHGSYSHTWSFPSVNTQKGCDKMKDELLFVLHNPNQGNSDEGLPRVNAEDPFEVGLEKDVN